MSSTPPTDDLPDPDHLPRPEMPGKAVPRMLAPSRILRETEGRAGGWREREELVEDAREMIARGSKSFYVASRLFDRATREKAWLLYAWCRRCDDLADGQDLGGNLVDPPENQEEAENRLQAIRVLTRRAFERQPTADPAFDGLGQLAMETGITEEMAEDVIAGFALDAAEWRPRTEADLLRYCYHVAGAVGVMMARVMGVPGDDGETLDRACDQGIAFQLANIARDLAQDADLGRCYIPQEWLAEEDIEPGQEMKPHHRGEMADIAKRLVALMERYEAAARWGTRTLPFRSRWAVLAAANIYGAIGREVAARGPSAWDERVVIPRWEQLKLIVRAWRDALDNKPARPSEPILWSRHDFRPLAGW